MKPLTQNPQKHFFDDGQAAKHNWTRDAGIGMPEAAAKRKEQKQRQDREEVKVSLAGKWSLQKLTYATSLGGGKGQQRQGSKRV